MEEFVTSILKRIDNIKRLRPETQLILLNKYSKQSGIPRKYLEAYMKGDSSGLLEEFNKLKEAGKITDQDVGFKTVDSDTDDSDSDEDEENPVMKKVNELKKGDISRNISDYIAKNKLFSKTENLVVLLDPVLKELLNVKDNKMHLKELAALYKTL